MYIAKVNADGKGGGKGASEQRKARLACLTCQPWDALTAYLVNWQIKKLCADPYDI